MPQQLAYELHAKGSNLSGGQKQRVLLSRALAGEPQILVLDDSASALDYQTDAKLRQVLKQQFADTTTILIAQRISSIQHADKILVLENGRMSGFGDHATLLATNTIYQEIYHGQTGGKNQCLARQSPKTKRDEKTVKRLWHYLYETKWLLLLSAVLMMASNLFSLVGPLLSGYAIDAIQPGPGKVIFHRVFFYCGWMIVFIFVQRY